MNDDFIKLAGILVVAAVIIYIVLMLFKVQGSVVEGLTNSDGTTTTVPTNASGEAGTAASYAAGVKAQVVKLQDELLVAKYRKDYESAIINMDDYAEMLMLKQILNINMKGDAKAVVEQLNALNTLKQAKDSLNVAMKFLDSQ